MSNRREKQINILAVAVMCVCFLCAGIIYMPAVAHAVDTGITITTPSDGQTTIASGRSFYVMGTFTNGATLENGDEVSVEITDSSGNVVRKIQSVIKNNTSMNINYDKLSYYGKNKPELLTVGMPDLIWLGDKTPNGFLNGDSKLYYDSTGFAALIPGGDKVYTDQMDLVDSNGNPYSKLSEGTYTITVSVTDKTNPQGTDEDVTGTVEKEITIGTTQNKILSRFSPAEHFARVKGFASQNNYRIYLDSFPGYWSKGNVFCEILPEWKAADYTEYLEGKVHFIIYNVKESSATYSLEAAAMQKTGSVDNPERLQQYYYEFGEPTLPDKNNTVSDIIPFASGDKLQFVRTECTEEATQDNVYNQDNLSVAGAVKPEYDLNLTDGIKADVGETISLYGVVALIQIAQTDIVSNEQYSYNLNNRIATVKYVITGKNFSKTVQKPVTLNRISGGWDNYSTLEFKHDIPITKGMKGKTLKVEVSGFDVHGNKVSGTSEQLTIKVSSKSASSGGANNVGTNSVNNEGSPDTGEQDGILWVLMLMAVAGGTCGIACRRSRTDCRRRRTY